MKNFSARLEKLEGTINVYKGKPAIFVLGDHLREQIESHNRTCFEELTLDEVMKWKKVKMGNYGNQFYLSPNWQFETWLKIQKENFNAQ